MAPYLRRARDRRDGHFMMRQDEIWHAMLPDFWNNTHPYLP